MVTKIHDRSWKSILTGTSKESQKKWRKYQNQVYRWLPRRENADFGFKNASLVIQWLVIYKPVSMKSDFYMKLFWRNFDSNFLYKIPESSETVGRLDIQYHYVKNANLIKICFRKREPVCKFVHSWNTVSWHHFLPQCTCKIGIKNV